MTLGKRKMVVILTVSILVFFASCIFLDDGQISAEQWIDLSKWIGGFSMCAFTGGNVLSKFAGFLSAKKA